MMTMIFPPSSAMSARPRCSSATTRRPPDGDLPHTRSLPAPGGAEAAQLLRLHRPNRHGTHTAACSRRRIARTYGSVAARETVGARLGRPRAAANKTSYSCRPGECNTAVAKGRCWRRRPRLSPAPLARYAPDALRAPDKPSFEMGCRPYAPLSPLAALAQMPRTTHWICCTWARVPKASFPFSRLLSSDGHISQTTQAHVPGPTTRPFPHRASMGHRTDCVSALSC